MASSTKWRLNITANGGGSSLGMEEVQFRTIAGADQPLNATFGGTASASSSYNLTSYGPARAADGNVNTSYEWYTANGVTAAWWQYEFPSAVDIVEYAIAVDSAAYGPNTWTLEYFDGAQWVVADTRTNYSFATSDTLIAFTVPTPPPSSNQWRVNIASTYDSAAGLSIADFQFRTVAGTPQAFATSGTPAASSGTAADAADGDLATSWFVNGTSGWWSFTFPKACTIASYVIRAGLTPGAAPQSFTFEYFDGSAWQVYDTRTNEPAWTGREVREYVIGSSGYTARDGLTGLASNQWRLNMSAANGATSLALADVQFRWVLGQDNHYQDSPSATASASGHPPYSATDADGLTYWATPDGTTAAIWTDTFTFGIDVREYAIAVPTPQQGPSAWTLERWDGTQWIVVDTQTAQTFGTSYNTYALTDTTALAPVDAPIGNGSISLPLFTLSVTPPVNQTLDGDLTLMELAIANVLEPSLVLSTLSVAGAGTTGRNGVGRLTLSLLGVSGAMDAPLALPLLDVGGTMTTGAVGRGDLPLALTLSATASVGNTADGALSFLPLTANGGRGDAAVLPLFDVVAQAVGGSDAQADLRLLGMTVSAADVPDNQQIWAALQASGTAQVGAVALGAAMLPALDALGGTPGALALPLFTLSASGEAGRLLQGGAFLATLDAAATLAVSDNAGAADLAWAALDAPGTMLGGTVNQAAAALLPLQTAAYGLAGLDSIAAANLPAPTLVATAFADNGADASLSLSRLSVVAMADNSGVAIAALSLPALAASGAMVGGTLMAAELTVPLLLVSASGYADTVGEAIVSLPVFDLAATATAPVVDLGAPDVRGIVLNTHTRATSTYANLAANSLTNFAGVTLAATPTGIVALIGDADGMTPIAASVVAGVSDFGADQFKRVLAGYAGYSATGTLELTLIADGHHEYVYRLAPRRIGETHAARVPFGRGASGRYWQWKIANSGGADFAIDALALDVAALSRRIG